MEKTFTSPDGKLVCHVYGTHFNVYEAGRSWDIPGVFYAYRNTDGTFETDIACGAQRYAKTRGSRQTANGLRRLGFSNEQVAEVLLMTLTEIRQRVAHGCLS